MIFSCFKDALNGILNAGSIIPKIITISQMGSSINIVDDRKLTKLLFDNGAWVTHKE